MSTPPQELCKKGSHLYEMFVSALYDGKIEAFSRPMLIPWKTWDAHREKCKQCRLVYRSKFIATKCECEER